MIKPTDIICLESENACGTLDELKKVVAEYKKPATKFIFKRKVYILKYNPKKGFKIEREF